jgi:hypothetical protein
VSITSLSDGSRPSSASSHVSHGDEVCNCHGLVAIGAWSSGAKPTAKDAALVAPLETQVPRLALRALVHDGGLRQAGAEAKVELVGRSLAAAEATLAAGIRAIGPAAT